MRSLGAALSMGVLVITISGCTDLPAIGSNECGNGIIEAPEACDTFAPNAGALCRPKGSVGQCRLDCTRSSSGSRPACPAGWGCDQDSICRAPTGEFEPAEEFEVGGAWSLQSGDFDGDGRADLISGGPLDAIGRTTLRFHYFDERGVLDETRPFPKLLASPVITDLSADGRSDVVFSDFRVGVLLGRSDRSLVPESFSSYRIPDATVKMIAVYDDPVSDITGLVALTTLARVPGIYVPDAASGTLKLRGSLPSNFDDLLVDLTSGNVIEDSPCREFVSALRGESSFSVWDGCIRLATGQPGWREQFEERVIALDPPDPIDRAAQLTDMDGDGHLDVLLGAGGRAYVSYGNGKELETARPYRVRFANTDSETDIPMPLAARDFTADGAVDFVFDQQLVVSILTGNPPVPIYAPEYSNLGAPWTVAVVADLNGNGKLDVVAASNAGLDIDFFNGTGTQHVVQSRVATNGSVQHLTVGDFDGDLIEDLAFIQKATTEQEPDSVMIAFGDLTGGPAEPAAVARVRRAEELSVYKERGLGNLMVASTESVNGRTNGLLTLLDGSGDRLPSAPYSLVSFGYDGSLDDWASLGLSAGRFSSPEHADVLALATNDTTAKDWRFWLLPALETAQSSQLRLDDALDPRLEPLQGIDSVPRVVDSDLRIDVVSASADFDRDGRDEAFWVMPADVGQHCGLVLVSILPQSPPELVQRATIILDEPCFRAQLLPVDADGDGWLDIALLTGKMDSTERRLVVLWNAGEAKFQSSNLSVLSAAGDSPLQFAALASSPDVPLRFGYVTEHSALLVSASAEPRAFSPPRQLMALEHGSGIAAADLNGDGVPDLALAASGDIQVLRAELDTP